MPWAAADAHRHTKKAVTAKQQRQWADIANSSLKSGKSDSTAIREANGVIARGTIRKGKSGKPKRSSSRRPRGT